MLAATAVLFLIEFVFGVVEFLIAVRILLKLLGASPQAPFVSWVYETSKPLLAPFLGMFPSPQLEGGFVIEFSALFGLLVYGIIAYMVTEIVRYINFNARRVYNVREENRGARRKRK